MTKGKYIRTKEIKDKNSKSRKGKGIGTCGKYIRTDNIKEKQHIKMEGHQSSENQKKVLKELMLIRNPMDNPQIRAKQLESTNTIEFKQQHSNAIKGGKNPIFKAPKQMGIGKGCYYQSPLQGKIWMRSSWEIAYAKYLDSINELWYYEIESYFLSNGITYCPDFFLPRLNKFIEIKGWMSSEGQNKIDLFLQEYPWDLEILRKEDLKNLGIKL